MNFFGGSNCGDVGRDCNGGFDCCSLIFLLLLLQNCGCGFGNMKGGEICIDCGTLLFLILLSNCGCGCK
ncbi:MAG: hypothetical protein ACI4R8_04985 [Candidatus Caccovivens sp.]